MRAVSEELRTCRSDCAACFAAASPTATAFSNTFIFISNLLLRSPRTVGSRNPSVFGRTFDCYQRHLFHIRVVPLSVGRTRGRRKLLHQSLRGQRSFEVFRIDLVKSFAVRN